MNASDVEELRALVDGYVAGDLSPEQVVTLENGLRASEEARFFFLAFLEVHAGLAWGHRGAEVDVPKLTAEAPTLVLAGHDRTRASRRKTVNLRWALSLAAAAVVLLGLVARLWLPPDHSPAIPVVVKASLHGQWVDGRKVEVGAPLPPGVWELQSGLVELETTSGTVLLVEAPARFELIDPLHGRLMSGNVVVRMPKGKSGFVIDLPQMRVTDLGTEFGVSVPLDGESRVQVFDGKVRAESLAVPGGREVTVGESVVCKTDGALAPEPSREDRFVRRFPPRSPSDEEGGVLFSRSTVDVVRVTPPVTPVVLDGDLSEWSRASAFHSACLPPYNKSYFVEGMMMYDAGHLYIAAHVGDPEPMRNASRDDRQFAGGSVIVRLSADRRLAWPLKGIGRRFRPQNPSPELLADSTKERVTSMILWHDAKSGRASLGLQHSFDFQRPAFAPAGWEGAFRKDADGLGYTLEYAIPWRLLHCESDPPRAGDVLGALWTVHWSDAEGRYCVGELVEVTNPHPPAFPAASPPSFFVSGPHWGRAVFESQVAEE